MLTAVSLGEGFGQAPVPPPLLQRHVRPQQHAYQQCGATVAPGTAAPCAVRRPLFRLEVAALDWRDRPAHLSIAPKHQSLA